MQAGDREDPKTRSFCTLGAERASVDQAGGDRKQAPAGGSSRLATPLSARLHTASDALLCLTESRPGKAPDRSQIGLQD